jgi:uncharacterized phage protein gp47/JayE
MPFNFPENRDEIEQRAKSDVQNELPDSNPFLRNSYLSAIVVAFSGRIFDFYLKVKRLIRQLFPDTATNEFLERWGSYVDILRRPGTRSSGNITITGNSGETIPNGTELTDDNNNEYITLVSRTINEQTIEIDSIERDGDTATVTTLNAHRLITGMEASISGADQSEYNGTFEISVTSETEFSYQVTGSPATPATGTDIEAAATFASVNIEANDFGNELNLTGNNRVSLVSNISGVDNTARVQYPGLTGGADQEDDESLRRRILFRYQNPVALFNDNAIEEKALEVPGVTRVFIESPGTLIRTLDVDSITRSNQIATVTTTTSHFLEDGQIMEISGADQSEYNVSRKVITIDGTNYAYRVEGSPASPATGSDITVQTSIPNGQVQIYFTRDDDDNIIPNSAEIEAVKNSILEIKPAHVSDADVVVLAPEPIEVNFEFDSLDPNTSSMRSAITASLEAFFEENTTVSQNVLQDQYRSVIYRTIDTTTGDRVRSFTLTTPSGDIAVESGQLPILGNIEFPN